MKVNPTPALVRLERKLARDRRAILSAADVRLLDNELRRALVSSFSDLPAEALERSEDIIRWHALGQRCQEARGARGIREVSVGSGIPHYRLRALRAVGCRRSGQTWRDDTSPSSASATGSHAGAERIRIWRRGPG